MIHPGSEARLLLEDESSRETREFCGDWTWAHVFARWQEGMIAQISPAGRLIRPLRLHDSGDPKRPIQTHWWPRQRMLEQQVEWQRELNEHPGTDFADYRPKRTTLRGEQTTLKHLLACKGNVELVGATLIAASLYSRVVSHRYRYPRATWPPLYCIKPLYDWAYTTVARLRGSPFSGWSHGCSNVLPIHLNDSNTISTMDGLVEHVIVEHTRLFREFQAVKLVFGSTPDKRVSARLAEDAPITAREANRPTVKRSPPAQWESWAKVSVDELQRLVWSMPLKEVGEHYGVTGGAVAKRCYLSHIQTPHRGFWNRVRAGLVPHPEGVPVSQYALPR